MKTPCKTLASVLAGLVLTAELSSAAVPTEWTVRVGPRSATYQAERYHGDALALRAALSYNGLPLDYAGEARLYAQTNGMGATWWDLAPCTVTSNVLQATWLPSFDTGADVVDLFLGAPSNYQAHARIRFLPSPGPVPNALPLPRQTIDFATIDVVNAPWLGADTATNAADYVVSRFSETGRVHHAETASVLTGAFDWDTAGLDRLAARKLDGAAAYPSWDAGDEYGPGQVVSHLGRLWRVPPYSVITFQGPIYEPVNGEAADSWEEVFVKALSQSNYSTTQSPSPKQVLLKKMNPHVAVIFDGSECVLPQSGKVAEQLLLKVPTNALAGQTYDFSRNYDIIKATADLIKLLGGTVTNNPTAQQGGN